MSLWDKLLRKQKPPLKASEVVRLAVTPASDENRRVDVEPDGISRLAWFLERDLMGAWGRKTARDWRLYDFIHAPENVERRRRYLRLINGKVEALSKEALEDTSTDLRLDLVCDAVEQEFRRRDTQCFEQYVTAGRGAAQEIHSEEAWKRLEQVARYMIIADYVEARQHPQWQNQSRAA
jgi:hypothetical protein